MPKVEIPHTVKGLPQPLNNFSKAIMSKLKAYALVLTITVSCHWSTSLLAADKYNYVTRTYTTAKGCFAFLNVVEKTIIENSPIYATEWTGRCEPGVPISGNGTLKVTLSSNSAAGVAYTMTGNFTNGQRDGEFASSSSIQPAERLAKYQMGCLPTGSTYQDCLAARPFNVVHPKGEISTEQSVASSNYNNESQKSLKQSAGSESSNNNNLPSNSSRQLATIGVPKKPDQCARSLRNDVDVFNISVQGEKMFAANMRSQEFREDILRKAEGECLAAVQSSPELQALINSVRQSTSTAAAVAISQNGGTNNAQCQQKIITIQQQGDSELRSNRGNALGEARALYTSSLRQKALFEGECSNHPQARSYVSSGQSGMSQWGARCQQAGGGADCGVGSGSQNASNSSSQNTRATENSDRNAHHPEGEANQCIRVNDRDEYGGFTNACSYAISYIHCFANVQKDRVDTSFFHCERPGGLWSSGTTSGRLRPGGTDRTGMPIGGTVSWIACREPFSIRNARFDGSRVTGSCVN